MLLLIKILIQHFYLDKDTLKKTMELLIPSENMLIQILLVTRRVPFHKVELLEAIFPIDFQDKEEVEDQWPRILKLDKLLKKKRLLSQPLNQDMEDK